MKATFLYAFRRSTAAMACWGLLLGLLGALTAFSFEAVIVKNRETLLQLLEGLPQFLVDVSGGPEQVLQPAGFLHAKYFGALPVFFGVYAIMAGAGLFLTDEESGRLDLLASFPISRESFFFGRVLALTATLCGMLGLAYVGTAAGVVLCGMDLSLVELLNAFVSVGATVAALACLAIFLSTVLPSRRWAAGATGCFLFVSFILTGLSVAIDDVGPFADLLPLAHFQGGLAINGLDLRPVLRLGAIALLGVVFAYIEFRGRDIRVAGENTVSPKRLSKQLAVFAVFYGGVMVAGDRLFLAEQFRTPEAVFHEAIDAAKDRQWERFVDCFSRKTKSTATGFLVAALDDRAIDELPGPTQSIVKLIRDRVNRPETPSVETGPLTELSSRKIAELAAFVSDQEVFLAESLEAASFLLTVPADITLIDVEQRSRTASGTLAGFGGEIPVRFVKEHSQWKIELSWPERQSASDSG